MFDKHQNQLALTIKMDTRAEKKLSKGHIHHTLKISIISVTQLVRF